MEEMFQTVIAWYFIFCLQNRLWGYDVTTPQNGKVLNLTIPFSSAIYYVNALITADANRPASNYLGQTIIATTYANNPPNSWGLWTVQGQEYTAAPFYWIAVGK